MHLTHMRSTLFVISFIALFLLFHIISAQMGVQWLNVTPYLALFFCAAALWQKSKLLLPAAIICVFATPFFTNQFHGISNNWANTIQPLIVPSIAYACIVWFGMNFKNKKILHSLLGVFGAAVFFHLSTNLWIFATSPLYAKTLTGLAQSIWTTPDFTGALPTALFFRNTCLSSLAFTALFLSAARLPIFRFTPTKQLPAQAATQ